LIGSNYVSSTSWLYWLGILLIYAGIALRFYAIEVLGRYFTTTGMAVLATCGVRRLGEAFENTQNHR
jgi:isoprenylcysteine carboxyl methyltransferase (ICMT) family protein YpbQ